jgi:hypothetical protein
MIYWKEIREKEGLGVRPSEFLKEDPEVAIGGEDSGGAVQWRQYFPSLAALLSMIES